ncbi:MAG: hypothetical protein KKG78_04775, partial [Alphaproteobacteria bacterium]|nr:hypothetical protein [Alphaproteobacteria bacterium]
DGARIDAGAEAGSAGYIEFSAGKDVLLFGKLSASSQTGADGTIFIDPENLTISTNQNSAGANLIYVADKTITVSGGVTINTDGGDLTLAVGEKILVDGATLTDGKAQSSTAAIKRDAKGNVILDKFGTSITLGPNATISTRKLAAGVTDYASGASEGKSGSVTLFAPDIKLQDGSKIYAQGTSGHAGGTVSLEAKSNEVKGYGFDAQLFGKTAITLTNATIKAGDIKLISEAYATNLDERRVPDGDGKSSAGGTIPTWPDLPKLPIIPQAVIDYYTIEARSDIAIAGSSLDAAKSINIDSTAITDVEDLTNLPVVAGFNVGINKTRSTINIANTDLKAGEDVSTKSVAQEYQNITGKLFSTDKAPTLFVSISDRDLKNQILIDTASEIISGRHVNINAETTKSLRQANNIANGTGGKYEASIIYSAGVNLTEVVVGGKIDAKGDITIKAKTVYEQYITDSSVGGLLSSGFAFLTSPSKAAAPADDMVDQNGKKVFGEDLAGTTAKSNAYAISVVRNIEDDKTVARVGTTYTNLDTGAVASFTAAGAPDLTAVGKITVEAAQINGVDKGLGGAFAQGQPIRVSSKASINASSDAKNAFVFGSAFSDFKSQVIADIGSNAKLESTGSGNIGVTASAETLKFRVDFTKFDDAWAEFFAGIDGSVTGGDSKLASGERKSIDLTIPDLPFDPRNFSTVATGSGSAAEKVGVAFNGHLFEVDTQVLATVRTGAELVTAGNIGVTASNTQQAVNMANQPLPYTYLLAAGASNGIGGSVNSVFRTSKVNAIVEGAARLAGNTVSVTALNDVTNISSANSYGKATKSSVNGAQSFDVIDNETIARIAETTKVTAANKLAITATDQLDLWSISSGYAVGANLGVGISNANQLITRSTQALIGNSDLTAATTGSAAVTYVDAITVELKAENTGSTRTISVAGGSAAEGYSGAASVGLQLFKDVEAIAGIHSGGKMVIGAGGLSVTAKNSGTVIAPTGALGTSLSGSLAGSDSTFVAEKLDTSAFIKGATITSGGNVAINAEQEIDAVLVAISGANTNGNAGAGASSVNAIEGSVTADLINASVITTGAATLKISSKDTSHINAVAGAVATGSSSALGASVAYNTIAIDQRAGAENSSIDASSVEILTLGEARIRAIAASATVGGSFTGNGAVTFSDIGNSYRSYLTGGNITARGGNISVLAMKRSTIESLAGGMGGSGSGSFGGAVSVNFIHDRTLADVLVTGKINAAGEFVIDANNSATVKTLAVAGGASSGGALSASVAYTQIGSATAGDSDIADGDHGDEQRDAVIALANSENKQGADLSSGEDETNAVLTANWNVSVNPEITARSVAVTATDTSTIKSLAGSVAGASTAGVGAALTLNSYHGNTNAIVAANGAVRFATTGAGAAGGLTVRAKNEATISTLAGALGAGGTVGGAGSATVNILNGSAYAGIVGVTAAPAANRLTVSGGNIVLASAQSGTIEALAGAVGAGGTAGIAGAVSVN